MGRVVVTAARSGFHTVTTEGDQAAPSLLPWDELVRMEGETTFHLSDTLSGFDVILSTATPDRPLGATVKADVEQLVFRNAEDKPIGHMTFAGGLSAPARCDDFGPDGTLGEALDLTGALLAEWAASDFIFRGAEGQDHLDLSAVPIGWTGALRLNGAEGHDALSGSVAGDFIRGGPGRDRLEGGAGDDSLHGNRGRDWLDGGAGNDVMAGGLGRDVFHFGQGATGQDRITDFRPGRDVLSFGADIAGREELVFEPTVAGLRIGQADGDHVILSGISMSMLTETDFQFV